MNPLLQQFLSEARDFLEGIGEKLMQLEQAPDDPALMSELFRFVHTLKGNSGLFDFPEMTRVLHAAEDLMDDVRNGRVSYSQELADRLLDAMDFVGMLCDDIETDGAIGASYASDASRLADSLKQLKARSDSHPAPIEAAATANKHDTETAPRNVGSSELLLQIPEAQRAAVYPLAQQSEQLHWIHYRPDESCFFQGEDPFFQARQTPGLLWGGITAREAWPSLVAMDAYRCVLDFKILSAAPRAALNDYFRYVSDQVTLTSLSPLDLNSPVTEQQSCADTAKQSPEAPEAAEHRELLAHMVAVQAEILRLPIKEPWQLGRMQAAAATLSACLHATGKLALMPSLELATAQAKADGAAQPLLEWLAQSNIGLMPAQSPEPEPAPSAIPTDVTTNEPTPSVPGTSETEADVKFGRRAEDHSAGPKSLKVDQVKIDRLMNLIGEMVVSKNALPYLATRAETVFGVRELSREIKAQYAVINRIAEEMQDAIMQVRMMPVSFVFQRFPRLVRDLSRKLGKDINLIMEGEDTEADKNIIESLSDPLVHIVRNSLDHGFELPEVRRAAGKPITGTLKIRAMQESDRVLIEIVDDGKGIDPAVIKRKAYEKGLLDEAGLERISDQEAVNLIFAAGFSTAEVISDLSGRGVGMDVVRTAVEKVNGSISLDSEKGKGTCIRLSLPLSMAVTNVMIIESDQQLFGVPMDSVVETVRVPRADIHNIKHCLATVLRGRIVALKSLNYLLNLSSPPQANADDELAVLIVRYGDESVGLLIDNFRETVDIILKPMSGVLADIPVYAGSALMGDGSVLMILNVKELLL